MAHEFLYWQMIHRLSLVCPQEGVHVCMHQRMHTHMNKQMLMVLETQWVYRHYIRVKEVPDGNDIPWGLGSFYWQGLTSIPAGINYYTNIKCGMKLSIDPFPNFNGCTIGVWEKVWIRNLIPHVTGNVIAYPYRG